MTDVTVAMDAFIVERDARGFALFSSVDAMATQTRRGAVTVHILNTNQFNLYYVSTDKYTG